MAHLVRQQKTYYVDAAGKRVPKGTRGAKKVREKSAKWYGVGIPGFPPKKRVPLAADKAAARRMLDDLTRKGEQGRAGLPDRDAARLPLADHLTAFEEDVALGLATKGKKKQRAPDPKHVKLIVGRVKALIDGCKFTHPADLNSDAPAKLARYLRGRVALTRKDGGLSAQSADYFLAAARRLARWLSDKAGVRPDLFDAIPGFDPSSDRKHARREVLPAELGAILEAARTSAIIRFGLTGIDRYHLYLTAFATGFRVSEIAVLTPESFDLNAEPPTVSLPAQHAKNKRAARPPLPPGVAALLRGYLATKAQGKPVWPGGWVVKAAKMLRIDLKAAGVPYSIPGPTGPAFADFHALRHSFMSALAAAGVGVKELQTLARHSDPRLTLGVYTHARADALGASVALLSIPGIEEPGPLSAMTRSELEALVCHLTTLLMAVGSILFPAALPGDLVTPRVTPDPGTSGDARGRVRTKT